MEKRKGRDRRDRERRVNRRRQGVQADSLGNFMTRPVQSISSAAKIEEAARTMSRNQIGSLLVTGPEGYVGIITESDVNRKVVAQGLDPKTTPVSVVTSKPIITMDHTESVTDSNDFMKANTIRHLPITRDGEIVGMFSVKDLVGYYMKMARK